MRSTLTLLACGALSVCLSACESTEQESAEIGRKSSHAVASTGTLHLGAINHDVRVSNVTLLNSSGRRAVVLKLTGTSSRPQIEVPVLVDVTGVDGRSLYSNDTLGLEASLQRMPSLRPGEGEWWVDDQVLTAQSPQAVHVRVGTGSARLEPTLPDLSASVVEQSKRGGLSVLDGRLVNRSTRAAHKVPVFAVATRDGRVSAAGRALVPVVGAGSATKPSSVSFEIFLVGTPTGSNIQLTVAPTAL